MAELVARFRLENVNRAPARFDLEKCRWMNQQHLSGVGLDEFAAMARPFVEKAGLPVPENFDQVMAVVKDKVRLLEEVPAAADFLLHDEFAMDEEVLAKVRGNAAAKGLLEGLADALEAAGAGGSGGCGRGQARSVDVPLAGRLERPPARPGSRGGDGSAWPRARRRTGARTCGNALIY
jgi:glutamyl-tRNA synthetase